MATPRQGTAFPLNYATDAGWRYETVYLQEIAGNPITPWPTVEVRRFANGQPIARGDTPDEALELATVILYQWHDLAIPCAAMGRSPARGSHRQH